MNKSTDQTFEQYIKIKMKSKRSTGKGYKLIT